MTVKAPVLSIDNPDKSVLEQLLDAWELDYVAFSDYLGLDRRNLWRYRTGKREFRLNMHQMSKLDVLLGKVGLRFADLPDDWFLDKSHNN